MSVLLLMMALAQDTSWLHYGEGPYGQRHSDLKQIDKTNVAQMKPHWIFQTGVPGRFETVPVVTGGRMFITGPSNHAWALDLLTGRSLWHYASAPPPGVNVCCGEMNRGFGISGNRLFKVNIEGDLVALDLTTGAMLWKKTLADFREGYSATGAPLVIGDVVITGIAGAEFGTRGFVDAYQAATGERLWRFYTVPAPGEPGGDTWPKGFHTRGGASTWLTGTYDAELGLTYWGTGNPGPDMDGDVRPGDNLYSCSVVAIDIKTGQLRWHYQFTPHDVHDWDAIADPVLADLKIGGRNVKTLIFANRNGLYYTLDRTDGKVLAAKPYTTVDWTTGLDAAGRPILVAGKEPSEEGTKTCPGLGGGHNWWATTYSPLDQLHYFTTIDGCQLYFKTPQEHVPGAWYQASTTTAIAKEPQTASIVAMDPATADVKWRVPLTDGASGGLTSTAGGLVFYGGRDGWFMALDGRSGKILWKFQTGGTIAAAPVTYLLRGKQYVAVSAGSAVITFGL